MKKIISIVIFSMLFVFTFLINSKASNGGYVFIDLVYNDNFVVTQFARDSNDVIWIFNVEDDIFKDYDFLDSVYFIAYDLERGYDASYFEIESKQINDNVLSGIVRIPRDYFKYYYETILGIDEQTFFNNINTYMSDLSNYFRLVIGDIPTDRYIYQVIDFIYDDNFTVTNYSVGTTDFTLKFVLFDALLDNNKYLQDSSDFQNNIYFQFYNFTGGLRNSYTTTLERPELSGRYLTAIVSIPKDSFSYYYDVVLGIDETTFFNNFIDYLEDISTYFKLYVRTDFATNYISIYNAGFTAGNAQGYSNGYNQGRSEGYVEGYNNGYEIGLQISQGEAYDQGYIDGYNNGSTESFIANLNKWIVPSIIIVMLLGGFFAITRKKRDGDI